MATLVLVTVATRVLLTRECFWAEVRASLERSRQSPQVHDETLAGLGSRGCAVNLVPLSISMVEETTSMWITPQHPRVFSY